MSEVRDPERLDLPSASQMEIVVACPGQPNLKATIPAEDLAKCRTGDDDEWAERGTRIHAAFETGNALELNPEEHETYTKGLEYLEKIKAKWIEDKALDPQFITEGPRELRVWLYKPYAYPALMGSAMMDRHFVYNDGTRKLLLVCDLKSGWNPNLPPSAHSWQLKYQLITLWKEEYGGVNEGRVAYVKAKDKHEHGDFCDYNEIDLKYSWDSIVFHSWFASQPDAPRHAGTHCRWCPCKAWCPEALSFSLLPSSILQLADKNVIWKKPEASVPLVSNEDLYRVWDAGSVIRNILDAISDRLKAMPDEQLAEIGLKHGKGRQLMEWTDVHAAFEYLAREKHWDEKALWNALEFGLGKLAKVAEKETGIDEKYSKDEIKKILAQYITFKEGEPMLRKLR